METLIYLQVIRENQRKMKNHNLMRSSGFTSPISGLKTKKKENHKKIQSSKKFQCRDRFDSKSIVSKSH